MKKLLMAPLILLGACATCCALPLLAPLLAGLLTSGISSAFGGWQIGLVVLTISVGAALVQVVRRRSRPVHSAASCQVACKSPRDADPCSCHTEPQA
jgi:hypothetical protein